MPISITPVLSKAFKKVVAGKLSHFWRETMLPSQFSYRRVLRICAALLTVSHSMQVASDKGMKRILSQSDGLA